MSNEVFEREYKRLNKAQKEAVDTIDGPVMVVAGPGTGKTQVLALRIANILKKTDTKGDGILCLTFTNAGVRAMRERLHDYIGKNADDVTISTFHSFCLDLIEKNHILLDFPKIPELLSDDKAVFLVDEILEENEWEYLRPRANPAMYFSELKQLISILKRERISADEFLSHIEVEIENLKESPDSISSRGETKGELKKEIQKKIESLSRTIEVVKFYRMYEDKKKELSFMDYDDVLEYATLLVEKFEDVRSEVRENYLYILVDEHQDSSGLQNGFLKAIWGEVDLPNIFVVGDDRQLIYGFSGASLSYFEEFSHFFGKAKLISLIENYRSTGAILAFADDLLKSSMADGKLKSNIKGEHKIILNEYSYPRDEIIGAGLYFKEKIKEGVSPSECALLIPRNYQIRTALEILNNMDLPVSNGKSLSLFSANETEVFRRVLGILADPVNSVLISESLLDKKSGVDTLSAHSFLKNTKTNNLTIDDLISTNAENNLFAQENKIAEWGNKLKNWINNLSGEKLSIIVSTLGNELLIDTIKSNDELLNNVEVVRSFIHLATLFEERNKNPKLSEFLKYLDRLESYNSHIELVKFGKDDGIQVITLHKSKGLEYKCIWIAHMNEEVLMSEKKAGFTLPEKIKERMNKRDIEIAKKELYVAITRAKEFCTISYAKENYNGAEMEVAEIIRELPDIHFIKKNREETEKEILENDPKIYTLVKSKVETDILEDIKKLVRENYTDRKVSVTLLNNFFECPWRWYFRNFLQLPEVKSESLDFGNKVHSAIDQILKLPSAPSQKEIEKITEGDKEVSKIVSRWVLNRLPEISVKRENEKSISLSYKDFPDLNIYGKLDLIEFIDNENIRVTDFKTGSVKRKSEIEKIDEAGKLSNYMRQLSMYSFLIEKSPKWKNFKVQESCLEFLEAKEGKDALYKTFIDQEKIDLLIKDIKDYDELLKTGDWTNLECHYNSYGKNTKCPYCTIWGNINS